MGVISRQAAEAEVKEWLKKIRVRESVIEQKKRFVDGLIEGVAEGSLVINDDLSVTQELFVPLGDGNTKKITYNPRYEMGAYQANVKNAEDGITIQFGVLATLSGMPEGVFRKMSREDWDVIKDLTVFF